MLHKLNVFLKGIWFFSWGNLFAIFTYDRKYLKGKYFSGKFGGLCAVGWRWVVTDCMARILLGVNKGIPFPVSPMTRIVGAKNIEFDVDDLNNFQSAGNYFQAYTNTKIILGKGSWVAPNVGIITANHDILNPEAHTEGKDIILGEKCWIGMNSMILPGVTLGPHTTVGAGSVVTKSFEEGYCVIVGNPARKIKELPRENRPKK